MNAMYFWADIENQRTKASAKLLSLYPHIKIALEASVTSFPNVEADPPNVLWTVCMIDHQSIKGIGTEAMQAVEKFISVYREYAIHGDQQHTT